MLLKLFEEIVKFSLKINKQEKTYPTLGIQNYLTHNEGRNIKGTKQKTFREFYDQLHALEKKLGAKNLVLTHFSQIYSDVEEFKEE